MKAELDRRADEIRDVALDAWSDAITNFAVVAVPAHLAGAVHEQARLGRLAELESNGRFVHADGVEPHLRGRCAPSDARPLQGQRLGPLREHAEQL